MLVKYSEIQKGSALVYVLIIAFVLMIVISGASYVSKLNTLSSLGLDNLLASKFSVDSYLENYLGNNSTVQNIDETKGGFRYQITKMGSGSTIALGPFISGEVYSDEPAIAKVDKFAYRVFNDDSDAKLIGSREFLYSTSTFKNITKYSQYDNSLVPVNVPYINTKFLSSDEKDLRLSNNSLINSEVGFIGAFEIDGTTISFKSRVGGSFDLTLPEGVGNISSLSVGWDLANGRWTMYVAVVINDGLELYTSSTALSTLVQNSEQAKTDLSSWIIRADFANNSIKNLVWSNTPTTILSFFSENSASHWEYYQVDLADNSLAEKIGEYPSTVSASYGIQTSSQRTMDSLNSRDIIINNVNALASDNMNGLTINGVSYPVISKYHSSNYNKLPLIMMVDGSSYIYGMVNSTNLDHDGNIDFFTYDVSDANQVFDSIDVSSIGSINYNGEITKAVIVRFGYIFLITDKKIYMIGTDSSNHISLAEDPISISVSNQNIQILFDEDRKQIYAMPNAMECDLGLETDCGIEKRIYFSKDFSSILNPVNGLFYIRDSVSV
ncbi:hypothetical protein [Francisella frigiditurris]|uniref:Uncharacterized protein n=1 Tax=Francisella frigiditurris TaxID=1542390 RepID=A0A1J0KT87_9GAMM|nr:hypothetical protein [Francisella frigiditurris]APC96969.1 hypothetical protein KX01_227 [Francisella frigiditurris]